MANFTLQGRKKFFPLVVELRTSGASKAFELPLINAEGTEVNDLQVH